MAPSQPPWRAAERELGWGMEIVGCLRRGARWEAWAEAGSPASGPHQRGAHEFPFLAQGRPRVAVVGGAEEGERPGAGLDSGASGLG